MTGPIATKVEKELMSLAILENPSVMEPESEIIRTDSVLVADDDAISRIMLQSCLAKWGLNVTAAQDGLQAWHELEKLDAPSLIILDWMMPGFSGIELCRKIRARKNSNYPYILVLTSRDAKENVVEALDAGADDYLVKPFNINELKARLAVGGRILALQNELFRTQQELRFQAQHDSLTRLWNRGAIMAFMEREIARSRRSTSQLGVLLLDIDHFKKVNDTYGHMVGDTVLQKVAERLSAGIRAYDWLGRYGGEEFIVLLANCNAETVQLCAERIREIVAAEPVNTLSGPLKITVSVGAALCPQDDAATPEESLQLADTALYRAKQNGRNRIEVAW